MEENNSQRQRQSRQGMDISVILSFVVAIFAVFSIATYGIVSMQGGSTVAYAAPTGDKFIFTFGPDDQDITIIGKGGSEAFVVPLYLAGGDINSPIFCVEHNTDVPSDNETEYQKGETISDYGLLYLLSHTYANEGTRVTSATGADAVYAEAWVTQVAIWMYLHETNPNAKNTLAQNYQDAIKATTSLEVNIDSESSRTIQGISGNVYTTYVKPLVDAAKKASSTKVLTVTKANGEISKTDDGKYYQSTLISVVGNPSSDFKSYDIKVSGIDGAIVVGEDGKQMSLTGVNPGKNFYVRIPKEKVTETVQTLTVSITGHFNTLAGNYYTAKDNASLQKVVSVTGANKDVSEGTSIEFVGAPDTGMNTAQTIYFIGLIVLLCGVGIVYANAKPVESKQ